MSAFFANNTSGADTPSISYSNNGAFREFFEVAGYRNPGWWDIACFFQLEETVVSERDAQKLKAASRKIQALSNRNLRRILHVDLVRQVRWLANFFVQVNAGDKIVWYP